jgi:hypothetical protein
VEPAGAELWRIVKLFSRTRQGDRRVGSGYLVSAGRVLTAAHVVCDLDSGHPRQHLEIVINNGGVPCRCAVDPRAALILKALDIAVVPVDPDWVEERAPGSGMVAPARFGSVPEFERTRASLVGFAAFKLREEKTQDRSRQYRDSEELDVEIARGSNMIEGTLQLQSLRRWKPSDTDLCEVRWSSMSGTAVWVGSAIVGVVSKYRPKESDEVLVAQPLEGILTLQPGQREDALDALAASAAELGPAPPTASSPAVELSSELTVRLVPDHTRWGTYAGISGGRPTETLLTQFVLSRVSRAQIVVDHAAGDLAADLNRTERTYRRIRSEIVGRGRDSAVTIPRRRWYTADLDEDPTTRGGRLRRMLLDGGAWTEGAEPAFVLRTGYEQSTADRVDRAMGSLRHRITDEYPGACVVVHVRAADAVTGVRRARVLSRHLGSRAPVYLRNRADLLQSSARWTGVRTMLDLIDALEHAADRAGQRLRLVPDRSAPVPQPGAWYDDALEPRLLVRRLVREVESVGIPATADGDLDDALLGSLRDYLPELYSLFLSEYAAQRTGSGWGVSMAFAARSERDLGEWIRAAEEVGAYPGADRPWPKAYRRTPFENFADIVRAGGVRQPERWRHQWMRKNDPGGGGRVEPANWHEAETWRRLSAELPSMIAEQAMEFFGRAEAEHSVIGLVLGHAPVADEGLVRDRIDELRSYLTPSNTKTEES